MFGHTLIYKLKRREMRFLGRPLRNTRVDCSHQLIKYNIYFKYSGYRVPYCHVDYLRGLFHCFILRPSPFSRRHVFACGFFVCVFLYVCGCVLRKGAKGEGERGLQAVFSSTVRFPAPSSQRSRHTTLHHDFILSTENCRKTLRSSAETSPLRYRSGSVEKGTAAPCAVLYGSMRR